jgi:HAD superfamily hydrolase (TIGR01509 family)
MKGIRAVIFDLHGTLLLSDDVDKAWDDWATAFHTAMTQRGASIPLTEFKEMLSTLFNGLEPPSYAPGLTLFERRVTLLCSQLGVSIPRHELRPLVENLISVWHRNMYLDPDVIPLLESLGGSYKVGMITNWEHGPNIHRMIDRLGIRHLFQDIVVSDDLGVSKPDPEIFRVALSRLGVQASSAVYVGDLDLDAQGALDTGMIPVLIRRRGRNGGWSSYSSPVICSFNPDKVACIERLSELPRLLTDG